MRANDLSTNLAPALIEGFGHCVSSAETTGINSIRNR